MMVSLSIDFILPYERKNDRWERTGFNIPVLYLLITKQVRPECIPGVLVISGHLLFYNGKEQHFFPLPGIYFPNSINMYPEKKYTGRK
jgi:hypothetical protein